MRIMEISKTLILGAGSAALVAAAYPATGHAASKCVESLWPSAKSAGITRATFDRAFQGFSIDPEIIELATYQPEYVKPIGEYIDRAVSEKRITIGKEKLVEHQALLGALERGRPLLVLAPDWHPDPAGAAPCPRDPRRRRRSARSSPCRRSARDSDRRRGRAGRSKSP